jgi:glycine cleavage system H lipoate-binding protein
MIPAQFLRGDLTMARLKKNRVGNNKESPDEYRKVVPVGERACLWAEAGVVPYKLCAEDYDCVNCPFDIVMRGGKDLIPRRVNTSGGRLCIHRFYSLCHIWAMVEEKAFVRIGIDDFAQKVLGPIEKVCLPLPGEKIGKKSIRLKVKDSIVPVVPSVEGYVEAVNEDLINQPQLANESPYDKGWLVLLRPTRLARNLKKLLYGRDATRWFEAEITRLATLVASQLRGDGDEHLGITMPDGGSPDLEVIHDLPPDLKKTIFEHCFLNCCQKNKGKE